MAMVPRPASHNDIISCQIELLDSLYPVLPNDYIGFLKICNGLSFNGVELYGTDIVKDLITGYVLIDIISYNEELFCEENKNLLFIGCVDDDIYTYNAKTKMYEVRDICLLDIIEEYSGFCDFFIGEIYKYLNQDYENDDDGRWDAYS